ncbi:MAG: response regulator [bacterium]
MKIIVADDDAIMTELLSEYFKELGHEVSVAYSGSELIEAALRNPPDLICSDIDMPGLHGESAQAMAEMCPELRSVPFIVVTGHPKEKIYALGLSPDTSVICKPIDFGELDKAVQKIEARIKKNG